MFRKPSLPTALRTVYAVTIFMLASRASGDDFSWQLSGGYGETELSAFAKTERTMLDATYHIDPVDDSGGPYALAPFLNRSSRVTVGVTNDKTTLSVPMATVGLPGLLTPARADLAEETTGYAVGGRYVWPSSGWYVGAGYRDSKMDRDQLSPGSRESTTTDSYQLSGGRYLGESTSLDFMAGTTRQATQLALTCVSLLCLSGSTGMRIHTDDWSIGALHLRQAARLSYSISGRVSAANPTASFDPVVLRSPSGTVPTAPFPGQIAGGVAVIPGALIGAPFASPRLAPDERETYAIDGELFPTDRLGFRIGLTRSDADYVDDETYEVAATWFFMRAAAVQFVLARTESEIATSRREIDRAELRMFGRL